VLAFTSLLTGIFFLALGYFKLGGMVRYIPYPVVGGFLAGTGWLLVQASVSVMTDIPLSLTNLSIYLSPNQILLWLPGTLLAFILLILLKRVRHFLIMPVVVIGSMVLFYVALRITDTSIPEAVNQGLLMGGLSNKVVWHPFQIARLQAAHWISFLGQSGNIATIFLLSVLNLLLNATGLELAIKRDIDINHELKAAGLANVFSGLVGGMIGYQTMSESTLSYHLKARGRIPGLIAGLIPVLILFTGASILIVFPKFIIGGLLLFLGLDFLYEWIIAGWSQLSRIDYAIVILILVVIGTVGFLPGIAIGLLSTVIMFVANYSQINIVHYALSGTEIRSNVERPSHHWELLGEHGDHTFILELKGFLFFGTASELTAQIKSRLEDSNRLPVRTIVLDFRRVSGLDSSAVFSFQKCKQLAESQKITIILTNLSERVKKKFLRGSFIDDGDSVKLFPDLDRGLEWCEDRILNSLEITDIQLPDNLWDKLVHQGFPKQMIKPLQHYLELIQIEKGEHLIQQGDDAEDLFLIESGKVSVYLESGNNKRIRLQTLSERVVVGELGLYIDLKRTASIIAEEDVRAYRLSKNALEEINKEEAALAAAIHEFIACLLARLLADTTRLISALDQ